MRLITRRSALLGLPAFAAASAVADEPDGSHFLEMVSVEPPDVLRKLSREQDAEKLGDAVIVSIEDKRVKEYRAFIFKTENTVKDPVERVRLVHDFVNARVRPTPDYQLYLDRDVWAPPLNTITAGGDCEDIALLKRWCLAHLGWSLHDMKLLVGVSKIPATPEAHAVLLVETDQGHLILDSLDARVRTPKTEDHFEPTYAVNENGFWEVRDPNRPPTPTDWSKIFLDAHKAPMRRG